MAYSKYGAHRTEIDGILFDSKREAARYQELKILEKAGEIKDLVRQPVFTLQEAFMCDGKKERSITYRADFMYEENGRTIVEDVKGMKTDVYKIKRKLFLYQYRDRYTFREV